MVYVDGGSVNNHVIIFRDLNYLWPIVIALKLILYVTMRVSLCYAICMYMCKYILCVYTVIHVYVCFL